MNGLRLLIAFLAAGLFCLGQLAINPTQAQTGSLDDAPKPPAVAKDAKQALAATQENGLVTRLGTLAFRFGERHRFMGCSPDGANCYTSLWSTNRLHVWDAKSG